MFSQFSSLSAPCLEHIGKNIYLRKIFLNKNAVYFRCSPSIDAANTKQKQERPLPVSELSLAQAHVCS